MFSSKPTYASIEDINHESIADSLLFELDLKTRKLNTTRKMIAATNAAFSLTLAAFSIFLNKQQAEALCKENFHLSAAATVFFALTNSSSNFAICTYTGSELFNAIIDSFIENNKSFYQKNSCFNKNSISLLASLLAGFSAAIPILVTVKNPIESKLAFTSSFIVASYSFLTLTQDLLTHSKNILPGTQQFYAALKNYENKLRGDIQPHKFSLPSKWLKGFFAIFISLGYVGPFFINNILIFNDPHHDLKFLNILFPEDKDSRLISAISFSGYCTLPWFILAGHFGYHLPEIMLQQVNKSAFSKTNPNAFLFLQILQGLISSCTWAIPVKFFLDVYQEFFDDCDDPCISLTVLWVAVAGILYVLLPNFKVIDLMMKCWNIALSSNNEDREYTYQIIGINEIQNRFKDLMMNLPANDINSIGTMLAMKIEEKSKNLVKTMLPYFEQSQDNQENLEMKLISAKENKNTYGITLD